MKINPYTKVNIISNKDRSDKTQKIKEKEQFEKVLNEKIKKTQPSYVNKENKTSTTYKTEQTFIPPIKEEGNKVTEIINKVLNKWEKYSHSLSSNSLKKSYSLLQEIKKHMEVINSSIKRSSSPPLKEIVEEMNILIATEEIKFNRGDYI